MYGTTENSTRRDLDAWMPAEMRGLADLSLHRVWWRQRWVLWFDEPLMFERRRPWSHHRSARILLLALAIATAALWAFTVVFASIGWGIPAAASTFALGGYAAVVAIAEVRFWAWWSRNDDRGALDAFRRPSVLHGDVTGSDKTLRALQKIGNPEELVEAYVQESGRRMRGWRTYGTDGWVRFVDIAEVSPLVRLYQALSEWRQLNEAWSDEAAWDAEFNEKPQRWSLFKGRQKESPLERSADKVLTAVRDVRASMERAAAKGLQKVARPRERRGFGFDMEMVLPLVATVVIGVAVIVAVAVFVIGATSAPPAAEPTSSSSQAPATSAPLVPAEGLSSTPQQIAPAAPSASKTSADSSEDTASIDAVLAEMADTVLRFCWMLLPIPFIIGAFVVFRR